MVKTLVVSRNSVSGLLPVYVSVLNPFNAANASTNYTLTFRQGIFPTQAITYSFDCAALVENFNYTLQSANFDSAWGDREHPECERPSGIHADVLLLPLLFVSHCLARRH